ncbi:MAG TPA: hypothetical protein VKY31_07735 [Terriglobia bacterium]|nr:hypothetical protein [Terriglobia bacterium]
MAQKNGWHRVKMKASWPQLMGQRTLGYDTHIMPGERIGPVEVGGSALEAVKYLGNPDEILLQPVTDADGNKVTGDNVEYIYKKECIWFDWRDEGLDPKVYSVTATCGQWRTILGAGVGDTPQKLTSIAPQVCSSIFDNGELHVEMKTGLSFYAKNRYGPITQITVVPAHDKFFGCAN